MLTTATTAGTRKQDQVIGESRFGSWPRRCAPAYLQHAHCVVG